MLIARKFTARIDQAYWSRVDHANPSNWQWKVSSPRILPGVVSGSIGSSSDTRVGVDFCLQQKKPTPKAQTLHFSVWSLCLTRPYTTVVPEQYERHQQSREVEWQVTGLCVISCCCKVGDNNIGNSTLSRFSSFAGHPNLKGRSILRTTSRGIMTEKDSIPDMFAAGN